MFVLDILVLALNNVISVLNFMMLALNIVMFLLNIVLLVFNVLSPFELQQGCHCLKSLL